MDLAGLTVVTGFLYSFFVTAPDGARAAVARRISLQLVSELQQALVVAGMLGAAWVARGTGWSATFRRLAFGAMVGFATLTLSNFEIGRGLYRSGFVYDFAWILPFAFFPWAATTAPASESADSPAADAGELERPRPVGDLRGRRDDSVSSISVSAASCRTRRCRASAICRRPSR